MQKIIMAGILLSQSFVIQAMTLDKQSTAYEHDLNAPIRDGLNLQHLAAFEGSIGWCSFAISRGADINMAAPGGMTPCSIAAAEGHVLIVLELLAAPQLRINQEDDNGLTPLLIAVDRGHYAVVEALLSDSRTDVNKRDKYGLTALLIAMRNRNLAIVSLLLADPRIDVTSLMNGDMTSLLMIEEARRLLDLDEFVNVEA